MRSIFGVEAPELFAAPSKVGTVNEVVKGCQIRKDVLVGVPSQRTIY
jgi:hypothetical protein